MLTDIRALADHFLIALPNINSRHTKKLIGVLELFNWNILYWFFYLNISIIFSLTFRASALLGFVCSSILLLVYVRFCDILPSKKKVSAAESTKTFWSDNQIVFIFLSTLHIDIFGIATLLECKVKVVHSFNLKDA